MAAICIDVAPCVRLTNNEITLGSGLPCHASMTSGHARIICHHANMTCGGELGTLPMTYYEFLRQLGKAGLTVKEFAKLIRMNRISISNNSKQGQSAVASRCDRLPYGRDGGAGLDYREVLSRIDIEPKKARGAAARGKFAGDHREDMFRRRGPSSTE